MRAGSVCVFYYCISRIHISACLIAGIQLNSEKNEPPYEKSVSIMTITQMRKLMHREWDIIKGTDEESTFWHSIGTYSFLFPEKTVLKVFKEA